MGPPVTVGIDIGTTSVKALAVDASGDVLAQSRVPHPLRVPSPTRLEHDADQAWRVGVLTAWDDVRQAGDVAAITVAAMVPSLAAVDRSGVPVGPGLLYGDERGEAITGAPPGANGEFEGFVRWSADRFPEAAAYWPAQAVANRALCGNGAIDTTTAMTTLPLFDGTGWDPTRCEDLGIGATQLPSIVIGAAPAGETSEGIPVSGGTIDAFADQLVAGADRPGDVHVICGATLICWAVTDAWREVDGLWTVPHTAPGCTLIGGASNAGGLFIDRVRLLLGDPPIELARRGRLDPAAVPVWSPYIRGERTPLHDATRRAALVGVDLTTSPVAALRAAYEAAGFVVRHHLELARTDPKRIVVSGGGSRIDVWLEAIADTTGLPVDAVAIPDGGALGAAFQARLTAGLETDTASATRWARTNRRVEPDPRWQEACEARYQRFRSMAS